VIFGHAGLAFTGFVCWISFLLTSSAALAWLGVGLLAPAIGLGISTVTVWTPYPAHRAMPEAERLADPPDSARPPPADGANPEVLGSALSDEALTSKLIDDLLASVLATPPPTAQWPGRRLAPLIPAAHGVLAIFTFLFAMLAAIAASVHV